MKKIKKDLHDNRKYFRIDDVAFLSYRIVSWADVRLSKKSDSKGPIDKLALKANLDRLSRELQPLYKVISSTNSNVAQYLSTLDERISLLSEYVLGEDDVANDVEPQQVNIGGGGLSFVSDKPVITGAMLELKMKFLPEELTISSYAKVISCIQVETEAEAVPKEYKISVEFEFMDEDVRDLITRHVLIKEQDLINSSL